MKLLQSIASLALAALVLLSSSSFMVGVHYCQGQVEGVSLFGKADCSMAMELPPCHRHMTNRCCEDQIVKHDGQEFNNTATEISFEAPLIAEVSSPFALLAELSAATDVTPCTAYDPPLRTLDRTIDLQVFII